ncbi:ABC transporter substrate-binding protein [Conexibacter sp. S30A1]|jgi:branched-chain amino acid transport system substrate-binding protein|uniref:ABC transporter substrate-binding protein n=1 Tax=Conexibacter sp. S30A1 TaxID=2937800 RepID=UPI00200E360B|nr:ABC transporter substrate-binding protein [Conexibacter sp. S30A1]
MKVHRRLLGLAGVCAATGGAVAVLATGAQAGHTRASAAAAPKQIVVGTLYASSGAYAADSLPQYDGVKFWVNQMNKSGGVYVAAYHKKIHVKLVAYNDQSSPTTAATLYSQLITQNHVNIMIPDFGSVLTAPAVSIAQDHHQLLFDATASGTVFFTPNNPYIVGSGIRNSAFWPQPLVQFLVAKHIKKIAILYDANDFDAAQAATLDHGLKAHGIRPVYYQSTATTTTTYGTLIDSIAATNPQAVIEFGYNTNDVPFLNTIPTSGHRFNMVFTVFPGQLPQLFQQEVGTKNLGYTYTYATPPLVPYSKVNLGLNTAQFSRAFKHSFPSVPVTYPAMAGYGTALIAQEALAKASSFTQLAMRRAIGNESGKLTTAIGQFKITKDGAQEGEFLPVGQVFPSHGGTTIKVVYPTSMATTKAKYPAPKG